MPTSVPFSSRTGVPGEPSTLSMQPNVPWLTRPDRSGMQSVPSRSSRLATSFAKSLSDCSVMAVPIPVGSRSPSSRKVALPPQSRRKIHDVSISSRPWIGWRRWQSTDSSVSMSRSSRACGDTPSRGNGRSVCRAGSENSDTKERLTEPAHSRIRSPIWLKNRSARTRKSLNLPRTLPAP
ncbi:hypothetical protein C2U72_21330 [Prosthecomicrobium hirschii]|nr:hypothetical protein C2U72_21330 [Prosthecomicrobium hirschii]